MRNQRKKVEPLQSGDIVYHVKSDDWGVVISVEYTSFPKIHFLKNGIINTMLRTQVRIKKLHEVPSDQQQRIKYLLGKNSDHKVLQNKLILESRKAILDFESGNLDDGLEISIFYLEALVFIKRGEGF